MYKRQDRDPVRKKKEANCKFTVCYPFDLYKDNEHYEYSVNAEEEENAFRDHSSIRYFSQDANKGKTFEYELAPVSYTHLDVYKRQFRNLSTTGR